VSSISKEVLGRPLRILHVGKYYPPHMGGTEIYNQQLVRLQSGVAEVTVVVANDFRRTDTEEMDGARLIRLTRFGVIKSMPLTPGLPLSIRKYPADIIHMHMPNPAADLSYLLSGHRGKLILTHHADIVGRELLRKITDPLSRATMRRANRIIATSQRYLDTSEELADFRGRCTVVPLGVDPARFAESHTDEISAFHAKYGEGLLVCVGRLVSFKGFQYAIEAMDAVDATLLIVGKGPMLQELQNLAIERGVADKVHFLGVLPNNRIPGLLKAAKIVLFPSMQRTESFGYVQLEAMASGVPVINTSIDSGAAEVSLHGLTGFTVPPRDSAALGSAINQLLNNEGLRRQFGAAGIQRVNENFTLARMAERTMAIYREALMEPSKETRSPRLRRISSSWRPCE
jgi:glycosyltransferase involved in cell wall biosynthesis